MPSARANQYGAIGPLLRRDAAEKRQIAAARLRRGAVQARRDAVVDGRREVCVRHRAALRIGDRHQRHVVESNIERMEIGQVLPAMQRGDGAAGERPEQREMKLIDMEVQQVELVGPLADAVEHQHIIGDRIAHVGVEPQRLAGRRARG